MVKRDEEELVHCRIGGVAIIDAWAGLLLGLVILLRFELALARDERVVGVAVSAVKGACEVYAIESLSSRYNEVELVPMFESGVHPGNPM